jgi:predicted metal-binding membrane protein
MSESAALFRRDRVILGAGLLTVALLAWAWLISEAHRMSVSGVCECMRMKMAGPDNSVWPAATLLPLFVMWCVMMVAMMLPSALPMVLTFAAVTRNRQRLGRPYVPTMIFVAGYLAIWCAFSAAAAAGQWFLHRQALLSPSMATTSAIFGGLLLISAGVFQFTPLKRRCLTRCRGTLEFILTRWREGRSGAFTMGLEHGAFCTGCCWALMALLFVAGVMNIFWVAALTLLVCLEKILPARAHISFATGIVLTGWGLFILGGRYFGFAVS